MLEPPSGTRNRKTSSLILLCYFSKIEDNFLEIKDEKNFAIICETSEQCQVRDIQHFHYILITPYLLDTKYCWNVDMGGKDTVVLEVKEM